MSGFAGMTFESFVQYCDNHNEEIFLRGEVNGQYGTYALGELSREQQMEYIDICWDNGRVPKLQQKGGTDDM